MFQLLLLLSCFTYWTVEAALPGQACCASNPCSNSICCNGFCSACCDDTFCPTGDYCIVQNPPPSVSLKYETCFPGVYLCNSSLFHDLELRRFSKNQSNYWFPDILGFILPDQSPCWRNEMCKSSVCSGVQQLATYTVTPGTCRASSGTFKTWSYLIKQLVLPYKCTPGEVYPQFKGHLEFYLWLS